MDMSYLQTMTSKVKAMARTMRLRSTHLAALNTLETFIIMTGTVT